MTKIRDFIWNKLVQTLTHERKNDQTPLSDFERLTYEIRPGDVLLVEGRSIVGSIIKAVTLSIWTHSMLYLGKLHDIDDPELRAHIQRFYKGKPEDRLIIESLLGVGTVVDCIDKYKEEHVRICRPRGLTRPDAQEVLAYAVHRLGADYNVRQLLDLARFMFPYAILPRRWRSSLFEHNAGRPTRTVCSTMMAEAFACVHFPIRPVLKRDANGKLKMYRRNSMLITPSDFDYSPFFDVIKYPMLDFDELAVYRKLPWDKSEVRIDNLDECYTHAKPDVTNDAESSEEIDSVPINNDIKTS